MNRVRILALTHTSGIALAFQLTMIQPFHELTWQTVMLRTGFSLGFIKTMGNA